MGCDIHGIFQKRSDKKWIDIPSKFEHNRHYQLFAVLADVRNGVGFAGCVTGELIKPISLPRGIPKDFETEPGEYHPIEDNSVLDSWERDWRSKFKVDDDKMYWMGDRSHSWLTGEEMLSWYKTAPQVIHNGIVSRELYENWDKKSRPDSYCGGCWGPNIITIPDTEEAKKNTPKWTHIECSWPVELKEELKYFFDEVQRLVDQYNEIRFVFGFDS